MPKILRIVNRFNIGGPTYNAALLTKYLEPDYETLLVGGAIGEGEDSSSFILDQLGLTPMVIPEMKRELNFGNDKIAYRKIKELISEFKPDIVHTHASKAGAIGRLAAHKMKIPVIVHTFHGHVFHSYFGRTKTLFYKTIERHLAKKTSAIVAISNGQKKELSEIHRIAPEEKIRVIHLGFDLKKFTQNKSEKRNFFREKYKVANDEIVVGIVGRMVPVKNHELFLRVATEVKKKSQQSIRFFIIGDGEEREACMQLAGDLGLSTVYWNGTPKVADVTITSWVKAMDEAYSGMDICALTSNNEGTPVTLIEAQAAGKPIVATNVGGIADIVQEGKTALLSPKGAVEEFSNNLLRVVEEKWLREQMAANSSDVVIQKFGYERLALETKQLYEDLMLTQL